MNLKTISILIITLLISEILFSQDIIPYRKKNKWGYANNKGEVVIEPQYKVAYPFTANITGVKKDDKYGFIDKTGKPVTKFEFTRVTEFYFTQATVWIKDTAYCIDKNGKNTPCLAFCDSDNSPLKHFETYTKNGKQGLINYAYMGSPPSNSLPEIIDFPLRDSLPAVWDEVKTNDLYAAVKKANKWGIVNMNGELITELIYDSVELRTDIYYRQCFKVIKNNKYGFLDEKGVEIVAPKYVKADFFSNGVARVWINDSFWFYIDKNGREYYQK
jgi:hypothetical protein